MELHKVIKSWYKNSGLVIKNYVRLYKDEDVHRSFWLIHDDATHFEFSYFIVNELYPNQADLLLNTLYFEKVFKYNLLNIYDNDLSKVDFIENKYKAALVLLRGY